MRSAALGIANVVHVRSGARHEKIGFDCATTLWKNQADKPELERAKKAKGEHERALRAERRRKADIRCAQREGQCLALLMEHAIFFRGEPHPHKHFADKGLTLYDYLVFSIGRGRSAGACKVVLDKINR